jgi:hypothetical protein
MSGFGRGFLQSWCCQFKLKKEKKKEFYQRRNFILTKSLKENANKTRVLANAIVIKILPLVDKSA